MESENLLDEDIGGEEPLSETNNVVSSSYILASIYNLQVIHSSVCLFPVILHSLHS